MYLNWSIYMFEWLSEVPEDIAIEINTKVPAVEEVVVGSGAEQDGALCDGCHQQKAEQDHEEEQAQQAVGIGHP